jgi:NAD(P)-dependent dehydrogenase (short-subunit alcohol dehydrogenase family)
MPVAKEPYRLEGRTALIVGPDDDLGREIAAVLTAGGAATTRLRPELPLTASSAAAIEAADILIVQTIVEAGFPAGADDWEAIDQLHLSLVTLPTALMAKAAPAMRRRRWGRVIFLSGGNAGPAAIVVRSAQSALVLAEARQLAADGITVNLVLANVAPTAPLAEIAASVAAATQYFAGEESSFVTGQTLQVGGNLGGK